MNITRRWFLGMGATLAAAAASGVLRTEEERGSTVPLAVKPGAVGPPTRWALVVGEEGGSTVVRLKGPIDAQSGDFLLVPRTNEIVQVSACNEEALTLEQPLVLDLQPGDWVKVLYKRGVG